MIWHPLVKKRGEYWYAGIQRAGVERIDWSNPMIRRKAALKSAAQEAYEHNNSAVPRMVETCIGDRLVEAQ